MSSHSSPERTPRDTENSRWALEYTVEAVVVNPGGHHSPYLPAVPFASIVLSVKISPLLFQFTLTCYTTGFIAATIKLVCSSSEGKIPACLCVCFPLGADPHSEQSMPAHQTPMLPEPTPTAHRSDQSHHWVFSYDFILQPVKTKALDWVQASQTKNKHTHKDLTLMIISCNGMFYIYAFNWCCYVMVCGILAPKGWFDLFRVLPHVL